MNFNSGGMFNSNAGHNGFFWNGAEYKMIVNVRELFKLHESLTEQIAKFLIEDNIKAVYDSIVHASFFDNFEKFSAKDDVSASTLCELMDSFGIKDEFFELLVLAFLSDNFKFIEDAQMVAAYLDSDESMNANELMDIHAFYDFLERINMEDFEAIVKVLLSLHDSFQMVDDEPEPQVAGADWLIGLWGSDTIDTVGMFNNSKTRAVQSSNVSHTSKIRNIVNGCDDNFPSKREYTQIPKLDPAFDYLLPFGLKIDAKNTTLQVMPESEVVAVSSPGTDGEMIADVVYKSRLFTIVGYSELGLSQTEKEELKTKIANLLATTKEESKSLLVQSRGTKFDVRYMGGAEIAEGPSFVKATIPLWTSVYGKKLFSHDVLGSGLLKNDGAIPVGPRIFVVGPCNPFSFVIGGETYRYSSSVPVNCKLFIDFEMKSVWLEDAVGSKQNMLKYFDGKFQKIPAQGSLVITVPDAIKNQLHTTYSDNVLW